MISKALYHARTSYTTRKYIYIYEWKEGQKEGRKERRKDEGRKEGRKAGKQAWWPWKDLTIKEKRDKENRETKIPDPSKELGMPSGKDLT